MAAPPPPITTHILNTVTGLPASNVLVTLSLAKPSPLNLTSTFTATTNDDGRVTAWIATPSPDNQAVEEAKPPNTLSECFDTLRQVDGDADKGVVWQLRYSIGAYFEGIGVGESFWEEVDVRFKTDFGGMAKDGGRREHWHIPLLLSPWSYTTYRGS